MSAPRHKFFLTCMIAAIITGGALAVSAVFTAGAVWRASQDFTPLGDFPEQAVLNRPYTGEDSPVAYYGDPVVVVGTKCVRSAHPVAVEGESRWARVDVSPVIFVTLQAPIIRLTDPGCKTVTFNNIPPASIVPGTWRIEGTARVVEGTRSQVVAWHTQEFKVVMR